MMRRPVLLVLLMLAVLISACGDDDSSPDYIRENVEVDLTETFTDGEFSVQHPVGWAVAYDPLEGVTLASSQAALNAFNASAGPTFDGIAADSLVIDVAALPLRVEQGTPADIFAGIAAADGAGLAAGEPTEISAGAYAGLRAPLEFAGSAGDGIGDLYVLRADDDRILLGIAVATGNLNQMLVEEVIASLQLPPAQ